MPVRRRNRSNWIAALVAIGLVVGLAVVNDAAHGAPSLPPPPQIVAQIPETLGQPQAPGTSVGPVYGSYFNLAIVAQGDEALVYLCDGDTIGLWFGARVDNRRFDVTTPTGVRLQVYLDREGASGTVTVPGLPPMEFETWMPVPGQTGLTRDVHEDGGVRYTTGLIFVPGGGITGTQNGSNDSTNGVRVPLIRQANTAGNVSGGGSGAGVGNTPQPNFCGIACRRQTRQAGNPGNDVGTPRDPDCVDAFPGGCDRSCNQLNSDFAGLNAEINRIGNEIQTATSDRKAKDVLSQLRNQLNGVLQSQTLLLAQMSRNHCPAP